MNKDLRKKRLQPVELGTVAGQEKHKGGELKRLTKGFRALGPFDMLTPWSYHPYDEEESVE